MSSNSEKRFRLIYDETLNQLRLISPYQNDLQPIIENFSCPNPAAFFVKQYGYNVPPTISIINSFGYFPVGMVYEVLKYIKTIYGSLSCIACDSETLSVIDRQMTPLKKHVKELSVDEFNVCNISKTLQLRDYQENIIKNLIFDGMGNGLFESPTSSGKSFILSNFIWTLHNKIDNAYKFLILVPNRQLVDQFYKDMLEYGFEKSWLCRLAGGCKFTDSDLKNCKVIISNRQYLFSNKDKLPKIDVLICDEVHQIKSNSSSFELIQSINPRLKVGCSGTLPRDNYELWSLKGFFGKIIQSENIVDLQKRGFITQLNIQRINVIDRSVDEDTRCLFSLNSTVKYSEDDNDVTFNAAWDAENNYITENFSRLYLPVLNKIQNLNGNILILFDRVKLGEDLFNLVKDKTSRKAFYIDGSTKIDDREDVRSAFEKSDNNILFAQSATFSTGISIKNLPNIAFFFSGKAFSKVIQSIGRALRLHKNKDKATLIDVVFNFKYSRRHQKERDKIYREIYNKNKVDNIIDIIL